jgi:hypothetical protein
MYSQEMLEAVALYAANLHLDGTVDDGPAAFTPADATTTSTTSTTVAAEG